MFKKWSLKKKIFIIVSIVFVLSIIAGILYYIFKPDPGDAVILTTVYSGDVTQTLDATAMVESANPGVFSILNGTKVISVNVRVGDKIKKGDILATFDADSLQTMVSNKQKSYNSALEAYNNYISKSNNATNDLFQVNNDIADLESEISRLEIKIEAEKNKETTTAVQSNTSTTEATSTESGSIDKLKEWFSSVFGINSSGDQLSSLIKRLLGTGNSVSEIQTLITAMMNGGSTSGFDFSSLTGLSADESKLTTDQLKLLQLKAQQTLLKTQSNDTIASTLKSVSESAKKSLDETKAAVAELRTGWIAKNNGIVRDVKINAGQIYKSSSAIDTNLDITTLLNALTSNSENTDIIKTIEEYLKPSSDGMLVEYFPFAASFILGKYDVLKVTMDQPARITAANGSVYNGIITYISPVASSNNSINISSLLGSSGGSSNGVEAKVSIPNPDKGVIIGFDVDISIDVDKAIDTTLVPAEAIQFDSDGSYVFIFNSETKTVSRSKVKTGIFSGSVYQVLSGCKAGDVIVKAPSLTLADGDKVTVQTTEATTTSVQ